MGLKKKDSKKKKKRHQWSVPIRTKPLSLVRYYSDVRTSESVPALPSGILTWPVLRAYVPEPWSWQASGFGTAGVVRKQPDGRCIHAFFCFSLLDNGLDKMFGRADSTIENIESTLRDMEGVIPPWEEGSLERASEFIWGAAALGAGSGFVWPPQAEYFLGQVPKPPGGPAEWRDRLVGPNGLTPPRLIQVIRENPQPEHLPEGKEIAIFTTATFRIRDREEIVDLLSDQEPELSHAGREGEEDRFVFTREYPPGHESSFARLGGRQIMGEIRVGPDRLIIETQTLSRMSRLIGLVKRLLGERLTDLETVKWTDMKELLSRGGRV